MHIRRPVVLCAALCILSAVCISYESEFIAYATAIVFTVASVCFIAKNKRSFVLLALCAICISYCPIRDSIRDFSVQNGTRSDRDITKTAVVENISQSYDNATLFLRLSDGKKALLRTKIVTSLPEIYDTVSFSGELVPLDKNTLEQKRIYSNPFYYYAKGCRYVVLPDEYTNLGRCRDFYGLSSLKYRYYYYITDRLKELFPDIGTTDSFSYVRALLTGERSGLDDGTYEIYRRSGLAPFLCISGLHVVVASAFLSKLLKMLHAGRKTSLFINLVFLFLLATVSGAGGSVVRASVMSATFCICDFYESKADRLSVLGISFMLMFFCQSVLHFRLRNETFLSRDARDNLLVVSDGKEQHKKERSRKRSFGRIFCYGLYSFCDTFGFWRSIPAFAFFKCDGSHILYSAYVSSRRHGISGLFASDVSQTAGGAGNVFSEAF